MPTSAGKAALDATAIATHRAPPVELAEENLLLTQARAGELGAFEKLVELHRDRVYGLALRMTRSEADAAEITQEGGTLTETVDVLENTVRAGININSELEKLNPVERVIAHAMILTEDPILAGTQGAGLDLKLIRSAKVYTIGATDGMGVFAIVEARNKSGKTLGSFVGGFLVSPCK